MLFGMEGILAGQAAVEYGAGAGRAGVTTAPAAGVSKSVGGIMGNLDKVLKVDSSATSSSSSTSGNKQSTDVQPESRRATLAPAGTVAKPAPVYEDAGAIQTGMASSELLRRFGPPSLDVTDTENVRTLTYRSKAAVLQLEMKDDKVSRISAMNSHQSSFVLPTGVPQ